MKYDMILKNARRVNRMKIDQVDIAIKNGKIERIESQIHGQGEEIDLNGGLLIPGVIDDQVHFREPGLTHKACIETEARAGVAGGVTTFMEMPNTKPAALTQGLLQDKYNIAALTSLANYSFYMGISNDNIEEALKTDSSKVCGLKIFMGSSTGNMLVDDETTLNNIFSKSDMLIATHCEDEETIRRNTKIYIEKYGHSLPARFHPVVRSREACFLSSSKAVDLARKHNTRLHILHISTQDELSLFGNDIDRKKKRITAEACVHHLTYSDEDYSELGYLIKCNPAIKTTKDRNSLWDALLDGRIDVIATDHAPHTWEEKQGDYTHAPSGLPLLQHSLSLMMDKVNDGVFTIEQLVDKMCHAPADIFHIEKRGYLEEGQWADMVLIDVNASTLVKNEEVLYKCAWSPLDGKKLHGKVLKTWVNGHLVFDKGNIDNSKMGMRLTFGS